MKILSTLWVVILTVSFLMAGNQTDLFNLNIFFTNDIHGNIEEQEAEFLNPEFPPRLGGGASAVTIIKKAQEKMAQQGGVSLLLDAGDIFQGTLVGTLSKGVSIVEYMNLAGYDACVPGNHDFDLGKENLKDLIEMSDFPWISCNIVEQSTGKIWSPLKKYVVKDVHGLKIGFTGCTTVGTAQMSFPENIKGLTFLTEIPALQEAVNELREKEKVDMVIAMVHTGLPYDEREGYRELQQTSRKQVLNKGYANAMEIAHFVKGIDVLLGGHLHKGYDEPWEDPVTHTVCVQNYGNGGNLGWLILKIDQNTKSIMDYDFPADASTLLLLQEDEFWPDSAIAGFIRSQQEKYEKGFREVIGTTQTALTRSGVDAPMYELVTDAMRERVRADFAFTNFGGVRADIKAGPVTQEDIFKVLPFGNQIVDFTASGEFIKRMIEEKIRGNQQGLAISGGKIVYNPTRPNGNRITAFTIDGQELQPDKMYRVATTDYLMEGNSGMSLLKEIPVERVAYTGILLREAVIEYVREHSPLNIEVREKWDRDNNAVPDPSWIKGFGKPEKTVRK
jgi:5'-nucleotidase/UDP-sugar diphosphatase